MYKYTIVLFRKQFEVKKSNNEINSRNTKYRYLFNFNYIKNKNKNNLIYYIKNV